MFYIQYLLLKDLLQYNYKYYDTIITKQNEVIHYESKTSVQILNLQYSIGNYNK